MYRNSNKLSLKAVADPGGGTWGTQPPPQVFLAQTEAWRAKKIFFDTAPPPLPPLSEGLDPKMQGSISVAMKNMDKAVL